MIRNMRHKCMLETMLKENEKKEYSMSYQLQNVVFAGSLMHLLQWGNVDVRCMVIVTN